MTIRAELYNGTVLEFPDGTDQKVIEQVAKQQTMRLRIAERKAGMPVYKPTDDSSFAGNLAAGAGKAIVDIGRGIKQIGAGAVDAVAGTNYSAGVQADVDNARERDAALMDTGGGITGNIAGNVAVAAVPFGMAARGAQALSLGRAATTLRAVANPLTYRAAAGSGAALGALQPTATGESRIQNAALGAAAGTAGKAVASALGRAAQPIQKALTPQDSRYAGILERAGVNLDPVQRTGSKAAEFTKRALSDNPITGPQMADAAETQLRQFTRAVSQRIGENADNLEPAVLDRAASRIGKEFERIAAANTVKLDGQLRAAIGRIRADASRTMTRDQASVIYANADEIARIGKQFGEIDGKAYQSLTSTLGRLSRTGQGEVKFAAAELKEALDDALERSAGVNERAAIREARGQWRRLLQIEDAVGNDGSGIVRPARLAQVIGRKANKNQWKRGRGDQSLANLARAGARLLVDRFPNSGTAQRLGGQLALGGGAAALYGGVTGDWTDAAKIGAVGFAAPVAARYAFTQAPNYLVNGLAPGFQRNALTALGQSPALPLLAAGSYPALR